MTTKNHTLKLLALTSLGTLFATGALAQDASYTYGGVSVGQSHGKSDANGMSAYQIKGSTPALTINSLNRDDTDNAYRVFLGYQFNRNVGLEASFFNLGRFNYHATTTNGGTLDGQTKIQGGGVDVVGTLPLSDNWSLLGRIGGQYAKTRNVFSGTGATFVNDPSPSARQFNYKVGAGVQYTVSPHFLLRGEAEQYRTRDGIGGNDRVQVFSLSMVFPFGAGAQQRTAMMPAVYKPVAYVAPAEPMIAAAPMVQAAPVAPMVAAAPIAPMAPVMAPTPRRVSFSAESLFGFDKSTIRPEGKLALDTFARDMAGTQFDVIVVEGHADRVGTQAYNQTLSMQRAEAVKAYLVSTAGMDANKITAQGAGETQPSQAGDCKASLPTAELRTCLQPDRRVDVGVTGTR
jgi:OOP family OmpA-OmpF porin